jgi:hypothetical protein
MHSKISPFRLFAFFTTLVASAFLVGCGGGGGSPADPAPSSLNGRTLTIRDAVVTTTTTAYVFVGTTSGTYSKAGFAGSGTFVYTKTVGTKDKAVLQLTDTGNPTVTYDLTFTSYTTGNYTDDLANSSTFTFN